MCNREKGGRLSLDHMARETWVELESALGSLSNPVNRGALRPQESQGPSQGHKALTEGATTKVFCFQVSVFPTTQFLNYGGGWRATVG